MVSKLLTRKRPSGLKESQFELLKDNLNYFFWCQIFTKAIRANWASDIVTGGSV